MISHTGQIFPRWNCLYRIYIFFISFYSPKTCLLPSLVHNLFLIMLKIMSVYVNSSKLVSLSILMHNLKGSLSHFYSLPYLNTKRPSMTSSTSTILCAYSFFFFFFAQNNLTQCLSFNHDPNWTKWISHKVAFLAQNEHIIREIQQ